MAVETAILVPEELIADAVVRALTGEKWCVKPNPWNKINPKKVKKKYIPARTPYFSHAWGGERPAEVEAVNDIFSWAASKLDCIEPDTRTDIIKYYMKFATDMLKEKSEDEVANMKKEELESLLGEALRKAVAEVFGLASVPETVEDAIRIAKDRAGAAKVCNRERLARKLTKKKLVAVSKIL